MSVDITISFILRFLLVFIFARAAMHKIRHFRQFCAQVDAYDLLPGSVITAFSMLLALVETYLALMLLAQGWLHPSFIASALLTLYALAMGINLVRGSIDLDCGCRGPSAIPQTIGWALVTRNGILAVAALITALPVVAHRLSIQDVGTIVLASIAVIFIYSSIEQAIVNQQRQRQYFALKANTNPGAPS
jgi:hypothetical protein